MTASRWLPAALVAGLAVYVHQLAGLSPRLPGPMDAVLGTALLAVPALLILARGHPVRRGDRWGVLIALGATALAGAHLLRVLLPDAPFPAAADWVALAGYPLLLGGLVEALRPHLRNVRLVVAVDGVSGAVAGAAFASWAIAPLVLNMEPGSLESMVPLASAVADAALVATAIGAVGIVAVDRRRPFVLMALGVMVFCVADISRIYQVALDDFTVGSWLDALAAVGMLLVGWGAASPGGTSQHELPGVGSLGVAIVSSALAVIVLAASPSWELAPVSTTLALLTLAACAARILLVLWELRELTVIREQAMTDELTGIANRRSLYLHLDALVTPRGAAAEDGSVDDVPAITPFAIAIIDLDHFKAVNDTLGHHVGDELLKAVVVRFAAALAELETPHLFARLGGDEFAVVLHETSTRNAALIVGEALQASLVEPVRLEEAVLHAQASIGLALAPQHGSTRADLLLAADAAMYDAKSSGSQVVLHSPGSVRDRRQRLTVAEDLFRAIERHELTVAYQPIRTPDLTLVAAEALVRWDHPERGRVAPEDFLEAAERYRLTHAIAERVLDVALGDLSRWRRRGLDMTMSVNVSATDLRDESIVNLVAAALLEHHLSPDALTIEITESALMHDPDKSHGVLQALDDLGVNLSVDDYGTGYSSLQYLLDLPIDEIKLGRMFVGALAHGAKARAIVASTIDLTHALGLRMVAEGVEDVQTLDALKELGCDLVQGYHVGRPLPAADFYTQLRAPAGTPRLPEQTVASQARLKRLGS